MKSHIEDLSQGPHLSEALKWFNVALRGLMEFGIVAAMSYWGYQAGSSPLSGVILAITAPLIVFGFWGLVDFHQAGRMSEPLRLVQELVISGLAAAALFSTGQPALGWTLGVISIIYHGLVYLSGETLLKQK